MAVVDPGQTYFGIIILCKELESDKFSVCHWSIDEFQAGSGPHQPVHMKDMTDSEHARRVAKAMYYAKHHTSQQQQQEEPKEKPKAITSRQQRRLNERIEKKAEKTESRKDMTPVQVATCVGEMIATYKAGYGIDAMVIEDQLRDSPRNRAVQLAVITACRALRIQCISVPPMVKMMFADVTLQKEHKRCANEPGATDKTISVGLLEYAMDNPEAFDATTDAQLLDLTQMREWRKSHYELVNEWYHKDLSDAFLQAVHCLKMSEIIGNMIPEAPRTTSLNQLQHQPLLTITTRDDDNMEDDQAGSSHLKK